MSGGGQHGLFSGFPKKRGNDVSDIVDNKNRAVFFDNIQFIYELILGILELESFGVEIIPCKDYRSFEILNHSDTEAIARRSGYFKVIDGIKTDYSAIIKYNRTRSFNQYLTHWFYPYKGKFHPQMIRAVINIIGLNEGETLLDPFVGSGTSAVEAFLQGIDFVGVDVSPLCVLLSKVKVNSYKHIGKIKELKKAVQYEEIDYKAIEDKDVSSFFEIADMIAKSDSARRRKNYKNAFLSNIEKMFLSIKDLYEVVDKFIKKVPSSKIEMGDSRELNIPDSSIDGIITSPPYSIALNYVLNDKHALEAMGVDISSAFNDFIGLRGRGEEKFKMYNEDMYKCYKEMWRVLKNGGYCVVILGNVVFEGKEVPTVNIATEQCENIGFKLIDSIDKIIFGLYNVMQREYILVFQKGG